MYKTPVKNIEFTVEVWKEGGAFVSYIPQLDLASCGHTVDEARKNIRAAAALFFEETKKMGTLKQVLDEAGFEVDEKKHWHAPEMVAYERCTAHMERKKYFELLQACK